MDQLHRDAYNCDSRTEPECGIASAYCGGIFEGSFLEESGLNPYDITKACTLESLSTDLCVRFRFDPYTESRC